MTAENYIAHSYNSEQKRAESAQSLLSSKNSSFT